MYFLFFRLFLFFLFFVFCCFCFWFFCFFPVFLVNFYFDCLLHFSVFFVIFFVFFVQFFRFFWMFSFFFVEFVPFFFFFSHCFSFWGWEFVLECVDCFFSVVFWYIFLNFWEFFSFSPHLCVGFLFLILYPGPSPPPPPPAARLPHHTIFHTPSLSTTIFHLSHTTQLCHTIFVNHLCQPPSFTFHTPLCHTPSFTHHLSHTSLSTTIFHTHLCQPSLSHAIFHTPSFTHHLSHTSLSTTIFHTPSFTPSFTHTIFHTPSLSIIFVNHHLSHTISPFVSRGKRGTWWQAWHLVTSTFVLRGRRGAWWHPPSFCVAGVALETLGWLWWRAWTRLVAGDAAALCVAGVALGDIVLRGSRGTGDAGLALVVRLDRISRRWRRGTLRGRRGAWWHPPSFSRGRRGAWWHPPSFCVAGVALETLGWLWWRAWTGLVAGDAAALCVAGVALGDIHLRFTWQAWPLVTSTFVSRGRRGTWWHPPSFCVAGVVLMALGWLWWRAWTGSVAGEAAALCMAGVALGDIHLRFAWQAWHLVTYTFVLRGRRGT